MSFSSDIGGSSPCESMGVVNESGARRVGNVPSAAP